MIPAAVRTELAAVNAQILAILNTGQSVAVTGSHALTYADLPKLHAHRARLQARILRGRGYASRTVADFSGGNG